MHNNAFAGPDLERDIDVSRHLSVLWKYWARLTIVTLVGACLAVGIALVQPLKYEAEVSLAISRPKISEGVTDTTAVANFLPLVENRTVAGQVIKEFGLDKAPYFASPTQFFGSLVEIQEVRNSTVVRIHGTFRDPQLAAQVVNRVAALGSGAVRTASGQEALEARDYIKLQRDEAKQRVDASTEQLRSYRQASQLELLKKDVDSALVERSGLLKLSIQIETEKSRLATAERELATRQRIETVRKSIDEDPALMEAAKGNGATKVLPLQMRSEFINPVYTMLDQEIATSRTKLAALERERAQMTARKLDGSELSKLTALYTTEAELSRLHVEADLAQKIYQQLATSYETARLTVIGRSSALQILAPAVAPDMPESRHFARTALAGAVAGLLLGAMVVLVVSARRSAGHPSRA